MKLGEERTRFEINPIPPGGSILPPLDFFKITLKWLLLRRRNFASFSSYLIDAFFIIFTVNDITASYDEVNTKQDKVYNGPRDILFNEN